MIQSGFSKCFLWQLAAIFLFTLFGCGSATNKQKNQMLTTIVPQEIVDNLLNKTYSPEEKDLISRDLKNIHETCFLNKKPGAENNPVYVATAGGPGACKSTILESYLHDNTLDFVYVDPDQRALRFMINTYHQSITNYDLKKNSSYEAVLKTAYGKWRDASNYIANTILNEAFSLGYNIAHGTTSTASTMNLFYDKLKQKNYKIVLLLCNLPDETRMKALEYRTKVQGFVQSAPEDVINKSKMFSERFPVYFTYADEIHFYWTQDFLKGSTHAATYTKESGLVVLDKNAFDCFVKKYDDDRKGTALASLNELIKK